MAALKAGQLPSGKGKAAITNAQKRTRPSGIGFGRGEGDEQNGEPWHACSPGQLRAASPLGAGFPGSDLINNAPLGLSAMRAPP